jgi:hypothetical protein
MRCPELEWLKRIIGSAQSTIDSGWSTTAKIGPPVTVHVRKSNGTIID